MRLITLWFCLVWALPLNAAPQAYALDARSSAVEFLWDFGPDEFTGSMAITQADLVIDFANLGASEVRVTVDASRAEAGFPFATQALRGPRMLDTATHPDLTFVSSSVTSTGGGSARISGDLTVRGVTRPASLDAVIYRAAGSDPGDLRQLTILLDGSLSRAAFGADGWADLVGDEVRLRITAMISQAD